MLCFESRRATARSAEATTDQGGGRQGGGWQGDLYRRRGPPFHGRQSAAIEEAPPRLTSGMDRARIDSTAGHPSSRSHSLPPSPFGREGPSTCWPTRRAEKAWTHRLFFWEPAVDIRQSFFSCRARKASQGFRIEFRTPLPPFATDVSSFYARLRSLINTRVAWRASGRNNIDPLKLLACVRNYEGNYNDEMKANVRRRLDAKIRSSENGNSRKRDSGLLLRKTPFA